MNELSKILSQCETSGAAPEYNYKHDSIVNIETNAKSVIVISDIHMGAGLGPNGTYSGTENFFSDKALNRFLCYYTGTDSSRKSILVINGDFIDFLRIDTIPVSEHEFRLWLNVLKNIGVTSPSTIEELKESITTEQKEGYGLKTHDYKSVWKLLVASYGHKIVFSSLADWVANGNEIIITKGNHDLEWHWLAVRNFFRYILAEHIANKFKSPIENVLQKIVLPNVTFINNAMIVNKVLYIEHGHRFDNFTKVYPEDQPTFAEHELNLPFGSFFNRYLLNKIELRYPYFENVRPRMSLLPMLIKQDFPLAVKVFFQYIPFLLKTIGKKRYWPMIFQTFSLFITIALPVIILIIVLFFQFKDVIVPAFVKLFSSSGNGTGVWGFLQNMGNMLVKDALFLISSYFLSRLVSMLQLSEPESLGTFANKISEELNISNPEVKIITLGHTHNPEQVMYKGGRWYYNTGTWIPVIEASSAAIREDRTYAFLKFDFVNGSVTPSPIYRWNDDGGREEELVLVVPGHTAPGSTIPAE